MRSALAALLVLLSASSAQALTLQQMTEEQRAAIVGDWKPLQVKGDAIAWERFEKTKEISKKHTYPDGSYSFDVTPEYTDDIKQLDGKEVTLMGFMFPLEQAPKQSNFLLGPYPMSCPFHYHVGPSLIIEVKSLEAVPFSYDPITLKGTLAVRFNAETGVFYYLENAKVIP